MLDAYIPEGALSPSAERKLLAKITDLFARARGRRPQQREGPTRSPGSSSNVLDVTEQR
jgi:hypothetical protein